MMGSHTYGFGASVPTLGTPTELHAGLSLAGSGSVTSGSITPTANGLVYAWLGTRATNVGGTNPTVSDSGGGTWTQVGPSIAIDDAGTSFIKARLYRQRTSSSPAARTVSVACTSTAHLGGYLFEVTSALDDDSNVITGTADTSAPGDPSLTLPGTQSATSTTLGFFAAKFLSGSAGSLDPPAGFTQLVVFTGGTGLRMQVCYRAGYTSPAVAWSTAQGITCAAALECKPG
jgi:hypothetical protein